ncbi:MAG: GNAT family N-acetyltransferase [Paracoccaceae bacterium]
MFVGDELDHFMATVAAAIGPETTDHLLVAADGDAPVGAALARAEPMAQGVTNLLFVGVARSVRRQGRASALIERVERLARAEAHRLVIVETAGVAQFEPARALYRRHGFEEEARVRDFYDIGLDKLIYRKAL